MNRTFNLASFLGICLGLLAGAPGGNTEQRKTEAPAAIAAPGLPRQTARLAGAYASGERAIDLKAHPVRFAADTGTCRSARFGG